MDLMLASAHEFVMVKIMCLDITCASYLVSLLRSVRMQISVT